MRVRDEIGEYRRRSGVCEWDEERAQLRNMEIQLECISLKPCVEWMMHSFHAFCSFQSGL